MAIFSTSRGPWRWPWPPMTLKVTSFDLSHRPLSNEIWFIWLPCKWVGQTDGRTDVRTSGRTDIFPTNVIRLFSERDNLTRISWLDKCVPPWVNTWLKHLLQQLQLWVCWDRSRPTLHTLIGQYLPILLNKTVQAQSSYMGSVDGQQFSSHATDFQLDLCQGSDWTTQGHLSFCSWTFIFW